MNVQTIIAIAAVVMLAVLGHSIWHTELVAVAGFFVNIFTGAHVTGLQRFTGVYGGCSDSGSPSAGSG